MLARLRRAGLAAILVIGVAAAPAHAETSVRFTRLQGQPAPGTPAKYNRVGILEVGPRRARNVLVRAVHGDDLPNPRTAERGGAGRPASARPPRTATRS